MSYAGIVTRNELARTLGTLYKANTVGANETKTLGSLKAEGELRATLGQPGNLDTYDVAYPKAAHIQVKGTCPVLPRKQLTPQYWPIHDPGLSIKRQEGGASYGRGHYDLTNLNNLTKPRSRARRAKA